MRLPCCFLHALQERKGLRDPQGYLGEIVSQLGALCMGGSLPDNTTVASFVSGTMTSSALDAFQSSMFPSALIPFAQLTLEDRMMILQGLGDYEALWRPLLASRGFRWTLTCAGGVGRVFWQLIEICRRKHRLLGAPDAADPSNWDWQEVMAALNTEVSRRYKAPGRLDAAQLLADAILQTEVQADTALPSGTISDLQRTGAVVLVTTSSGAVVYMPQVILEWISECIVKILCDSPRH